MNADQFRESLRFGTGRALLYARDNDVTQYREVILDACLHCYSYDTQVEGTRSGYMYDLVEMLPDKGYFYDAVLKSLARAKDDNDSLQRFWFAAHLAKDGNERAKRAMYDNYDPGPAYGESIGIAFLELDGIRGLLFVADKIGGLLRTRPDKVDIGWVICRSIEAFREQATWDALRDAGRTNPNIDEYRQAAEESHQHGTRSDAEEFLSLSYEQLLKKIPANQFYSLRKWGEAANDQELELAARGLIAAKDAGQQTWHLLIFSRRRFPLPPDTLIALAETEDAEDSRVGLRAVQALRHVSHPVVRELAFRLVRSGARWRGEAVDLLNSNFKFGDHKTVLGWFETEKDLEVRHSFGMDLREFWEQHPDADTEIGMLLSLYEMGPCSACRERAVKRLIELGALPEQLRKECTLDANSDIRDFVREG
jgi:hypothetical protein